MTAVIQLRPCDTCQRDPGFGTLHVGCAKCARLHAERETQPRLVVIARHPLTYGEAPAQPFSPPPVIV